METLSPLKNRTRDKILAQNVLVANKTWERMKGLLGRDHLASDSTMWIKQCNSIHTWFMKFSIDVVFVDKHLIVHKVVRNIGPWRLVLPVWNGDSVFEFSGNRLGPEEIAIGDQLYVGD